MENLEILSCTPDCEIVTQRKFSYPQELVYEAWSNPNHLKNWWGPKGFTNTFQTFDFKPGGIWKFIMHGPDGMDFPNESIFLLMEKPDRIIWNHISQHWFQMEATFEAIGIAETLVSFKMKFKSAKECEKVKGYAIEKNEENMDRLGTELKRMQG